MSTPSANADRNLLFGILALQMDFITRDALIAAMNAWVLEKNKPLSQVLLEQGAIQAEDRDLLEVVVKRHLALHGDDAGRSLASLSSLGSVRDELRQVADPEVQASLVWVSAGSASENDPYKTQPPFVGQPTASGLRYRILRPHAKGGLGEVFVAHDAELHREVALKEIQTRHADHKESRARFLLEAEVTGGLEHPGVVPVYGLGCYADGRPYYAMRFVKGQSLQEAMERFHKADEGKRDPGERALAFRELLGRFVAVCNAVAYAHSRGVLHRDLKPQNVMLGKFGETLVVDWGLAKVVGQAGDDDGSEEVTLRPPSAGSGTPTELGAVIGTPAYMSPEQAAGKVEKLGPASDIYSLAAVLYGVLTGRAPFERSEFMDVPGVLVRVQRGLFPPPREVKAGVPRGLEAVCLKAMATKPDDRYPTALDLAADVEHWLADEPVSAYREPWSVKSRRWMRRHRPLVAGAAALLLAAIPLSIVIAVNREQARQQAEADKREIATQKNIADAVLKFVDQRVFAAARPERQEGGLGAEVTLRRAVEAALPFVANSFTNQPLIEARLRLTLGASFGYLGDAKIAAEQEEAARALYAQHLGLDHADTLRSMNNLATSYYALGRHDDALKLFEETLALKKAKLGPDHPDTLVSMGNLAYSFAELGRHADALKLRQETLALRKAKLGPDHPDTLMSMNDLANSYAALGRHADALKLNEETLALRKAKLGPDHPDTLVSMGNLANSDEALGRHAGALKLNEETLALQRAKLGPNHPDTLNRMDNLAISYHELGRHADALKLHKETLALMNAKLGRDHPSTLICMNNLAVSYMALERYADALKLNEETLALRKTKLGPDHPDTLASMHNLADSYAALGRHADALKLFEETLALKKAKLGPDHPDTLLSMWGVAESLVKLDRGAEAVPIIDDCVQRAAGKVVHPDLLTGVMYVRLRHFEKTKDPARCRQTAEMWEKLNRADAQSLYNAACMRAVTAAVLKSTPGADATRLAKEQADRAIEWLHKAVAAGYKDAAHMKKDKDLDALRDREEFKKLLAELAAGPAKKN